MSSWKLLLPLLASLIVLSEGGGRVLNPNESLQILEMFRRYCSSPSNSPNREGSTFFYCKTSNTEPTTVEIPHVHDAKSGDSQKQVIFIQPPPQNYIHNVDLRGSGKPQETEIYVLPQTDTHKLNIQDNRREGEIQKPNLYYVTENQPQSSQNPAPIGVLPTQPGNGNIRPSAQPPNPSYPAVIGIGNGLSSSVSSSVSIPQQQGYNYNNNYGVPSPLSPRNQRNVAYNNRY